MATQPIGHLEQVRAMAGTARLLFIGGTRTALGASEISVFDHVTEKPQPAFDVPAHVLALTANEAQVFVACADGKVRIHAHNGKPEREIAAHDGAACTALALRGDDLLTGGADGMLRLFSAKSGKKKSEWKLSPLPLRAVAIDPEGHSFAAGGDDGVIRVLREGDAQRDMPGHDGPVTCLSFTPADGRLVSGGEDGTVRIWYLVGAIESEIRAKDDTLHVGGATALFFPPAKNPAEQGDRFVSAGADGKLRVWRLSDRRKPRTFEAGSEPIHALAWVPSNKPAALGSMVAAGEARTVYGFGFDAEGAPADRTFKWEHGFDVLKASLAAPARATREAAVKSLAAMSEREALDLLLHQLATDREPDVRALIATELASHDRRDAKKAIRAKLDDDGGVVRAAALEALRKLEADAPLSPLRSALDSRFADTRVAALKLLPALAASSPLAGGLIASRLADSEASVRRAALAQLVTLYPARALDPLRTAFERGSADVRVEVLVRGAVDGLASDASFAPLVGKALDDEDADVRRIAFVVTALTRPTLAAWLEKSDEAFGRALADVVRRATAVVGGGSGAEVPAGVDPDPAEVTRLSTAFAQFQHPKHGEVSVFQPKMHTPIKVGDKVHLIGIKAVGPEGHAQLRATDYVVNPPIAASTAEVSALRGKLVGKPAAASPTAETDREPLLSALACRTSDTALRGARGLALLGDMRALGALLTISREPDAALRRDAAVALVALEDPRAKRRLVWMMNDAEASVRDAALGCYAKLESDAIVVAEAALHSSHEDIRVRGLDALVKEGKGKPAAEALLGDSIEDEAPKVRSEAFRTLWSWHANDPLAPLDRALTARFPDLRMRAVQELATFAKKKGDALAAPSLERLAKTIADRDAGVARAAYKETLEIKGKDDAETHLAAFASTHAILRGQGARDAAKAPVDKVRSPLSKLLEDLDASVRIAAIETLDILLPAEHGAVAIGLQSSHLDLRVRAAELLASRREESIIEPMRALLADKELLLRLPPAVIVPLRHRAATALGNLGSPRLLKYFATELVKDDDPMVREQAARGLSNASRRGEEGYLLDLLGHEELPVRSWAAEGLARLGDARALPVLTGTLRHEHPPIRIGAILSFAALGPEGYGGMLQGLEDPSRDVQRVVLSVILARDLRAFRRSETPDLLTSALSSQRPEVRFAAARALELRIVAEHYIEYLVDLLMPDKPEKASDMERWPDEETRARLMVGLAEALAGDRPEQRYAAAQALRLRDRPIDYFREIQRAAAPRSIKTPWVPDTTPRAPAPSEAKKGHGPLALLRRLFAGGAAAEDEKSAEPTPSPVADTEQTRLRLLAFGAYVGLLRQATADDEAHRVRRDTIERIVDLTTHGHVSLASSTPALARALDDPNHLVRQAAFAALKKTYPTDPETPLSLALASSSADVIRAALDELAARGEESKPRIIKALDSRVAQARKYAFDLLEKLSVPGSLEPLLAALGSEHADIRIGVLERLATSQDARVARALGQALQSDHDDLRLRAAEMLAHRRDDRAAEALGPWLRAEDAAIAARARAALSRLGSAAAVRALARRLEDEIPDAERVAIAGAIAATRAGADAIDALAALFADEQESVRSAAFEGCLTIVGPRADAPRERGKPKPKSRDAALSTRFLTPAAGGRHADVRGLAARELDDLSDTATAGTVLIGMFGDRDRAVRAVAVASYAKHVEEKRLPARPLEDVLRSGARETMLSAAWGLAHEGIAAALRPLLLFARAGEPHERQRALLGLGALGDKRALAELEIIAAGGTEEAPAEIDMQAAALEALGRLTPKLEGEDQERVRDRVESSVGTKEPLMATAAVRALRWLGDERSIARLTAVLTERSSRDDEQVEAAKALGKLGDAERAEAALAKALDHDSDDVRWAAREALEELFPNDRTRVEFLAVESSEDDISEPAASYLANEGDAGLLLKKLAKLSNESLRQRLRFGLVRREKIPAADLEQLLSDASPAARADAAWVTGGRAKAGDAKTLVPALVVAAKKAETARGDAAKAGKESERDAEQRAWVLALWAAREIDAGAIRGDARRWLLSKDAPREVRFEAAFALRGGGAEDAAALTKALSDLEPLVRTAAASSLAPAKDVLALKTSPFDPTRLGLASEGAALHAPTLASSEGRRALEPRALRDGETDELAALASKKSDAQLDAIAALGRAATAGAIDTLTKLASKDTKEEEVRKAAFRSLRRAQRIQARRARLDQQRDTVEVSS